RRPASRMPEHARRIRFRRKALRQPDEFHTLTNQAVAWLGAHRELAAGIGLAALVAAAAVVAVSQYRASQVGRAAEGFRAAQTTKRGLRGAGGGGRRATHPHTAPTRHAGPPPPAAARGRRGAGGRRGGPPRAGRASGRPTPRRESWREDRKAPYKPLSFF